MRKLIKAIGRFILCFVILSLIILGVYTYMFSPDDYSFSRDDYVSAKINEDLNGLTIAYISDINLSDDESLTRFTTMINELNEYPFDMVIFGGDLYDSEVFKNTEVSTVLKSIHCQYGKFAVLGDKDLSYSSEVTQILNNGGFEVLENEQRSLYYNNTTFNIIAGDEDFDLSSLTIDKDTLTLCISHKPDTFLLNKAYVDLQISGHSYGGQIYIPYIGPLFDIEGAMNYNHGTYVEEDASLIVSNGVSGPSSFPYKLFSRNHINLITLKKQVTSQ